jgi:tetratricopeptide (TPR) repeat protein
MLQDRYGLDLSTASDAARDAYVQGCELALTLYPGAVAAFDRAIAADPDFALAYAGRARALQLVNDIAAARTSIAAAQAFAASTTERERSHVAMLGLLIEGKPVEALQAVRAHVGSWPRDALVVSTAANQNGLIGTSSKATRVQDLLDFLGALAPHYGDDWWFNGHYAMALSELGHLKTALPLVERSIADNPRNAMAAHALAHFHYENANADAAIAFLRGWLPQYPRDGGMFGHLHWHLAVFYLQQGAVEDGFRLFTDAFAAEDYRGPPMVKLLDAASYLWRSELAGHKRDEGRWQQVIAYAHQGFGRPGMPFVDWHVALTGAVDGEGTGAWMGALDGLVDDGRYPAGETVPCVARAFAAFERGDYTRAIAEIETMFTERDRLCGSRAQIDLVEFTLLKAYLEAGRLDDARRLLSARRPGPSAIPVAGLEAVRPH